MTCPPTVGEVRECTCGHCATRPGGRAFRATPHSRRWRMYALSLDLSRIVEVSPRNRARVTAGPPWMAGGRP